MKSIFLDNILNKIDKLDGENLQAFIHKLAKHKEFLEVVFEAVKEGIIVIDRNLDIMYNNRSAADLIGIPPSTRALKISTFLKDIDWSRILQEDKKEWDRMSRREVEIFYPVRRTLSLYLVPHGETEEFATIIISDITEKLRAQNENIESEKLALMSMLAAGVAHEIGNPLNSLNIHLQLLERDFRERMDDEAIDILSTAISEVKRLDTIISQFLGAIRPVKMNYEPTDILDVLYFTIDFMRSEIDENHIEIETNFPDVCPIIQADHNQLKQAFFNIIKNAVQAMPSGGVLSFDVSIDEDKGKLSVSISDTGWGISANNIANVFEPYFSAKKNGTGLGLMIVERIIREHGAELIVESEPGHGTRFTIIFSMGNQRVKLLEAGETHLQVNQ